MDIATLEKFFTPEMAGRILGHLESAHPGVYEDEPTPKHAFLTVSLDRINDHACTLECNLCGQELAR